MKIATRHFAVPADLQPYLDSFWFVEADGPASGLSSWHYCLASGLVEMIFHVPPHRSHTGIMAGRQIEFPESFIGGIHLEPVMFRLRGGTGMFGISCKPEMFVTLFNLPIAELVDSYAELDAFFGASVGDLAERIREAPTNEYRVQTAAAFFRRRAAMYAQRGRFYLPEAMEYIRMAAGQHSVDELCGKVFVGKRQLQRAFQDNIGISPKTYGRIARFKGAYDYVQRHPSATWTEISYHFGYADQSHFIRDFKEFTGENPRSFLAGCVPQQNTPLALAN